MKEYSLENMQAKSYSNQMGRPDPTYTHMHTGSEYEAAGKKAEKRKPYMCAQRNNPYYTHK